MSNLNELRRWIQRELIQLTRSPKRDDLHKLAAAMADVADDEVPGGEANEEELLDFIMDALRSDRLASQEDQGVGRLLSLSDLIRALQQPPDEEEHGMSSLEDDAVVGEAVGGETVILMSPKPEPVNEITDVIKLRDVTALLPRREFKLHCGQISDSDSDVNYNTLCKQIDEGLAEKFTDAEVIRTVIKLIKPGTFKDMLSTKEGLTVAELKRFLRAHLRDKSSAELFQELSHAKQYDKESPQQFMYRLMGLKQRVLFASQQSESEFQYDSKLVQGVFLHSLYQGLNEKYTYVRRDLKPHIVNMNVTEDFILEIMTQSVSEEVERQTRLGQTHKTKTVTVNATQQGGKQKQAQTLAEIPASVLQTQAEVLANRMAINELTAQVSALTKSLEKALNPAVNAMEPARVIQPTTAQTPTPPAPKGRCQKCIAEGVVSCKHCFKCGQEGHRSVGCLVKTKPTGNWRRPLGRDHQ